MTQDAITEQSGSAEVSLGSPDTQGALSQAIESTADTSDANSTGINIPEKFNGDVSKLVESYNHLESKMGSMYSLPSQDSSEEKWNEFDQRVTSTGRYLRTPNPDDQAAMDSFFNSLGRPESPDKYAFDLPEEMANLVDKDTLGKYTEMAHKAGLTNDQAKALMSFELERSKSEFDALATQRVEAENQLKQMWGPDFDNRLAGAKAATAIYQEKYPDAINQLLNSPERNNPALIAMFSELGEALREKGHAGSVQAPQYGMSSADALDKIREIQDNPAHAYHDDTNPSHLHAVDRVKQLYAIAYPDE